MKKSLFCTLATVSALVLSSAAEAKNAGGGFYGPAPESAAVTVEQAKNLKDDTFVVMRGSIKQMVGKEKYLFEDNTGTIMVEIDDDDWNGVTVGPNDVVEIRGEVDTHWRKPTNIDVDSVTYIPVSQLKNSK